MPVVLPGQSSILSRPHRAPRHRRGHGTNLPTELHQTKSNFWTRLNPHPHPSPGNHLPPFSVGRRDAHVQGACPPPFGRGKWPGGVVPSEVPAWRGTSSPSASVSMLGGERGLDLILLFPSYFLSIHCSDVAGALPKPPGLLALAPLCSRTKGAGGSPAHPRVPGDGAGRVQGGRCFGEAGTAGVVVPACFPSTVSLLKETTPAHTASRETSII